MIDYHIFRAHQDEIERLKGFWENNRKTSEANSLDSLGNLQVPQQLVKDVKDSEVKMIKISLIQLDFDRLDYENYDYDGIGVLNFNKAPTTTKRPNRRKLATKISKR